MGREECGLIVPKIEQKCQLIENIWSRLTTGTDQGE